MTAATWLACFDRFEDSVAARERLLSLGLAPDQARLDVAQDEAGPVEGNFLVGNGRSEAGAPPAPHAVSARPEQWVPYGPNFANPVARGVHRLYVHLPATDGSVASAAVRELLTDWQARPLP